MSNEVFSYDENGRKIDAHLHDDNHAGDRAVSADAVKRAIARGMEPGLAQRMYGHREYPVSLTAVDHDPAPDEPFPT